MPIEDYILMVSIIGLGALFVIWPKSEAELKFQQHLMDNPLKALLIAALVMGGSISFLISLINGN